MNNDDKGVAERVVSGEATFFGSKTETRAQRSPKGDEYEYYVYTTGLAVRD